jgi:hypothetical protein
MSFETVIGLEIHAQLATKTKIFSGAATAYGAAPNVQANLVDLGYPGVLPVLNREAVRMAIKFGLAIGANVAQRSVFARKNYFYPDLPKGYQISQYEKPIVEKGTLDIVLDDGTRKTVFSHTLKSAEWENTRVAQADLATEIRRMKSEPGPGLLIMGSGQIVAQLSQAGLIDAYQLVVVPIVLGRGRTLFEGVTGKPRLALKQTRAFPNGNVVCWYERQ